MLNIVLFGPPGAGKGTQSEKLIARYNLVHLSTGDIFRANIKSETELGKLAQSFMNEGKLVPDEVTINMLASELEKAPNAKGFIFDGFPRTQAQAAALDVLLQSKNTAITSMLALEVEEEELKKRLLLRGKDSGRADDQNPEIIQQFQAGTSGSVLFLSDGKDIDIIGFNTQFTQNDFLFSSVINASSLTRLQRTVLSDWIYQLSRFLFLKGLHSLDFNVNENALFIL